MKKVDTSLHPLTIFNNDEYNLMDKVRFDNFNTLDIDFKDKTILELGSGIGNHTDFLLSHNPKMILSIEGRPENYQILKDKFKGHKKVITVLHDLEKPFEIIDQSFDWIYNYGLLYHLKNPFEAIDYLKGIDHENMILETCIDISGYENNIIEGNSPSQALNGIGSRPNMDKLIDKLLTIYQDVQIPKQPKHHYYEQFKRIVLICIKVK